MSSSYENKILYYWLQKTLRDFRLQHDLILM